MEKSIFKKPKEMQSFRLNESASQNLKTISEKAKISRTEILEILIESFAYALDRVTENQKDYAQKFIILVVQTEEKIKQNKEVLKVAEVAEEYVLDIDEEEIPLPSDEKPIEPTDEEMEEAAKEREMEKIRESRKGQFIRPRREKKA
jgi:hypothetical protein